LDLNVAATNARQPFRGFAPEPRLGALGGGASSIARLGEAPPAPRLKHRAECDDLQYGLCFALACRYTKANQHE